MEFTLTITGNSATDLSSILASFGNQAPVAAVAPAPAAAAPKKQAPAKTEIAAPAATETPAPVETAAPGTTAAAAPVAETPAPTTNGEKISIEQVRAIGAKLRDAGKSQLLADLLTEFGAKSVSLVPDTKLGEFYSRLQKLAA